MAVQRKSSVLSLNKHRLSYSSGGQIQNGTYGPKVKMSAGGFLLGSGEPVSWQFQTLEAPAFAGSQACAVSTSAASSVLFRQNTDHHPSPCVPPTRTAVLTPTSQHQQLSQFRILSIIQSAKSPFVVKDIL